MNIVDFRFDKVLWYLVSGKWQFSVRSKGQVWEVFYCQLGRTVVTEMSFFRMANSRLFVYIQLVTKCRERSDTDICDTQGQDVRPIQNTVNQPDRTITTAVCHCGKLLSNLYKVSALFLALVASLNLKLGMNIGHCLNIPQQNISYKWANVSSHLSSYSVMLSKVTIQQFICILFLLFSAHPFNNILLAPVLYYVVSVKSHFFLVKTARLYL